MDLVVAKLVAFALWAEAFEGVTGKAPGTIKAFWDVILAQNSIDALCALLGEDLEYKLYNYLTVWEAAAEEAPPPTEQEEAEAVVEDFLHVEEAEPKSLLTGTGKPVYPETATGDKPPPKKKEGKGKRT